MATVETTVTHMDEPHPTEGILNHTLNSWKEFPTFIADHHANSPAYIYRGQADAEWKIESTIDRLETRYPEVTNYVTKVPKKFGFPPVARDVHLAAFKESVRGKRGANPPSLNENEWWAMAQHHGLATPILDWTYSPFVALFYAFQEHGYVDWKTQEYREPAMRAVYVVSFHMIGDNATEEHSAPEVFTVRREITNRLSSQAGLFMKMPEGVELEQSVRARFTAETYGEGIWHPATILTKVLVPNDGRTECLKFLNKMNINRMSLFPDVDGCAKYINDLWELDFDTALGAIPDEAKNNAT